MPAKSKKQKRFFEAIQHNKEFADKVDIPQSVGEEMTKGNVGKKAYKNLPEEKKPFARLKAKLDKK
jgi:hypothetical protein